MVTHTHSHTQLNTHQSYSSQWFWSTSSLFLLVYHTLLTKDVATAICEWAGLVGGALSCTAVVVTSSPSGGGWGGWRAPSSSCPITTGLAPITSLSPPCCEGWFGVCWEDCGMGSLGSDWSSANSTCGNANPFPAIHGEWGLPFAVFCAGRELTWYKSCCFPYNCTCIPCNPYTLLHGYVFLTTL